MKDLIKINVDPSIIYFTHSKIRKKFSGCGKLLQDTLNEIIEGTCSIKDIPMITVNLIETGTTKTYYTKNNRRLWLFKQCKELGICNSIEVYVEYLPSNSKQGIKHQTNTYSLIAKPILS